MEDREIVAYCQYCKEPIYEGEAFTVNKKETYHTDCWTQSTTFAFGELYTLEDEDLYE